MLDTISNALKELPITESLTSLAISTYLTLLESEHATNLSNAVITSAYEAIENIKNSEVELADETSDNTIKVLDLLGNFSVYKNESSIVGFLESLLIRNRVSE
jgi:hypothetical protein